MTVRGWNPTAMPRREGEHAFLHPKYDGSWLGQTRTGRPSALVVEERKIKDEVSLEIALSEQEPSD